MLRECDQPHQRQATISQTGLVLLLVTLIALALTGCATYRPKAKHETDFLARAHTQTKGEIEVTAAVLSAEESRGVFGVDLAANGIQPVWFRIRNNEDDIYALISIELDPEYFSAHEAAWRNHFLLSPKANAEMDDYFRDSELHPFVLPDHTNSGFVFTRLEEGFKFVSVTLQSVGGDRKTLLFTVPVPGIPVDLNQVNLETIYGQQDVEDMDDLAELRSWIEKLPCCVFGEDNETPGDPLNLVLIGSEELILPAFIQQDWHPTEIIHGGSLWKTVESFLFGSRYRYSPVSALYLFGRPQDFALQKARETVDERNHLRVWLAPVRHQGQPVWVGQISRDIGVRFTGKFWPLTTHVIDRRVDEARWYLTQDLILAQRVAALGLASGVGLVHPDEPRFNLLGDPYYTDGLRLVAIFTDKPVAWSQIQSLGWEYSPDVRRLSSDQ